MQQRPSQADRQDRGAGAPAQKAHALARRSFDQEHPAGHCRRGREQHAADPGRALVSGDRQQHERHEQQRAALDRQPAEEEQREDDGRCRRDMLRHPCRLKQPAAKAGRGHEHLVHGLGSEQAGEHHTTRQRGVEQQDPQQRRRAAAEPVRQSEHQRERRERGEPRHRDIGFPAARSREERELGGAEMPEVVVGQSRRRLADRAEERVARRQSQPRHLVDQRDLGVVEDRGGANATPSMPTLGMIATAAASASTAAPR